MEPSLHSGELQVSVIIPAHNEQLFIEAAVESVHRSLDSCAYEVLVVADHCSDRTAELAEAKGAQVIAVDLRQISAVRNAGARRARGEFLIFLDADSLLNSELAQAALEALRAGAAGGGGGV